MVTSDNSVTVDFIETLYCSTKVLLFLPKYRTIHKEVGLDSYASCALTVDLAVAITSKDPLQVKMILSEENDNSSLVNSVLGPLGVTPLHLASATSKSESMVSLLIEEGAMVSTTDKIGRSALHYSSALGKEEVTKCLIANGADVNCRFGIRSQPTSVCDSGEKLAKDLIPEYEGLPLPECWGRTPLHQAVKGGHVGCVELLLQNGADVNAEDEKGLTPLLLAGAGGLEKYEAIVDLLVFHGAEVNKVNPDINSTPVYHAVALGSLTSTQILLNAGATLEHACQGLSSRMETVLHVAASGGSTQLVQLLMNHGAAKYINCCNTVGCTPLHKAAYVGSRNCLKLLIDCGGDISVCSDSGMTVVDIIMSYVPRPVNFLTDCLNARVNANASSINDRDFKIFLDFTILSPSGCTHQMSVVSSMASFSKLLQHPLVESFVLAKWAKLRFFFLFIALIHLSFVVSLSVYFMTWVHTERTEPVSTAILMPSSLILLLHSATELLLMGRQRLSQIETWLTLINSSAAFMITLQHSLEKPSTDGKELIPTWTHHIASIIILFSWCGFMSLIGRFPSGDFYALMFSLVFQNVLKVFLTFIFLVIGFALSFSVQFPYDPQFSSLWPSIVRTIVMMTGEYDYTDLFSNNSTESSSSDDPLVPTSRAIFVGFVLLASVALMNLMVGLAVSDIQGLRTEGNIRRLQKQTDFVSHLERILNHPVFQQYFDWWVPRFITRHQIPRHVPVQPSTITKYEILPTPLIEALINLALQNRRQFTSTKINIEREKYSKEDGIEKSSLLSESKLVLEDITQLKHLLLEVVSVLNSHHNSLHDRAEDVTDSSRPTEDHAINVNAMLRRVSTPRHPIVHQVFH